MSKPWKLPILALVVFGLAAGCRGASAGSQTRISASPQAATSQEAATLPASQRPPFINPTRVADGATAAAGQAAPPSSLPARIDGGRATTAAAAQTAMPAGAAVCAPLAGYSRAGLAEAVSNPYHPPEPGSDDPHHGVDLAVQENGIALAGAPVQAALAGRVAAVIADRFPYGNAVLIETPLEDLSPEQQAYLQAPTPAPTQAPNPALTCPAVTAGPPWESERRSLYVLYAHLQEYQPLAVEQAIVCGEALGTVGQSGNALNPHLHFEARVGPGGARFDSMAHYKNSASPVEMGNYCLWRVRGVFQLVDPMRLLSLLP